MRRFQREVAAVVVASVMIVAGVSSGPAAAADVVKIGVPIFASGALADTAQLTADGYKFWAANVNRRGGIDVGGKKLKVELVTYDDQSIVGRSAQLTERLIFRACLDTGGGG